jgi:phosphoglycolate phosphatase
VLVEGLPPVAYNDGRRMIGGGVPSLIERALDAEGHHPPKLEIDRMFCAFVDHYGAPRENSSLLRLLEELKLSHHFVAFCGQDTFGVQKPDPEILRQTILRAGGEPAHANRSSYLRREQPCDTVQTMGC